MEWWFRNYAPDLRVSYYALLEWLDDIWMGREKFHPSKAIHAGSCALRLRLSCAVRTAKNEHVGLLVGHLGRVDILLDDFQWWIATTPFVRHGEWGPQKLEPQHPMRSHFRTLFYHTMPDHMTKKFVEVPVTETFPADSNPRTWAEGRDRHYDCYDKKWFGDPIARLTGANTMGQFEYLFTVDD